MVDCVALTHTEHRKRRACGLLMCSISMSTLRFASAMATSMGCRRGRLLKAARVASDAPRPASHATTASSCTPQHAHKAWLLVEEVNFVRTRCCMHKRA